MNIRTVIDRASVRICTRVSDVKTKGNFAVLTNGTFAVGLSSCAGDKHIHVDVNKSFVGSLIARAEPDIDGSQRERHAKTLDVAQEEVLTCIGIYLFERFEKIYRAMRSEEQTWQLLILIAIDCLRLSESFGADRADGESDVGL